MEPKLGQFKRIFFYENVYGTSTVSTSTLNQSRWKVAYCGFIIMAYLIEVFYLIFNKSMSYWAYNFFTNVIMRTIFVSLPVYTLARGILDYKTKIASALNLEAIESKLGLIEIALFGRSRFKWLILGLDILTFIFHSFGVIVSVILHMNKDLPITTYLTTPQYLGTNLLQGFGLIFFLAKVVAIKRTIKKGFSEIVRSQRQTSTKQNEQERWAQKRQRTWNRGRRFYRAQTEAEKKWSVLTELQGCLHTTESMILDCYWVQIIWYRLVFEVVFPYLSITVYGKNAMYGWIFMTCWTVLLSLIIVYMVELANQVKKEACRTLNKDISENGFNLEPQVKHQLLAQIHRSRVTFSCTLFDVNYPLLAAMFENFMFVVTTMVGAARNNA